MEKINFESRIAAMSSDVAAAIQEKLLRRFKRDDRLSGNKGALKGLEKILKPRK